VFFWETCLCSPQSVGVRGLQHAQKAFETSCYNSAVPFCAIFQKLFHNCKVSSFNCRMQRRFHSRKYRIAFSVVRSCDLETASTMRLWSFSPKEPRGGRHFQERLHNAEPFGHMRRGPSKKRGVTSRASFASISAPALISKSATSLWPLAAAQ